MAMYGESPPAAADSAGAVVAVVPLPHAARTDAATIAPATGAM
jgi:hypothetical protein